MRRCVEVCRSWCKTWRTNPFPDWTQWLSCITSSYRRDSHTKPIQRQKILGIPSVHASLFGKVSKFRTATRPTSEKPSDCVEHIIPYILDIRLAQRVEMRCDKNKKLQNKYMTVKTRGNLRTNKKTRWDSSHHVVLCVFVEITFGIFTFKMTQKK